MKTIGFDIDGVLYKYHEAAYRHLKHYHGVTEDYTTFWKEQVAGTGRFSETFWDNFSKIPVLYEVFIMLEENLNILSNLAKSYEIIYVTHRPIDVKFATIEWFKYNKLPYADNIYFVEDKTIPVLRHQCKYFVDDTIKNIVELEKVTNAILMKKPWHTNEYLNYTYIENLKELEILL